MTTTRRSAMLRVLLASLMFTTAFGGLGWALGRSTGMIALGLPSAVSSCLWLLCVAMLWPAPEVEV